MECIIFLKKLKDKRFSLTTPNQPSTRRAFSFPAPSYLCRMGNYLASNLKYLRKRRKRTQEEAAFSLNISRSTLNGYEQGVGEPKIDRLMLISDYYRFRIDDLVRLDLSQLPESKLRLLEVGQ